MRKVTRPCLQSRPKESAVLPLVLIIEFKDAVYEANIALSRSRSAKGWRQTFAEKAEKVCGFYRLQNEIEKRKHQC